MNSTQIVVTALQTDYMMIMNIKSSEAEIEFMVPTSMYSIFKKTSEILNLNVKYLKSTDPNFFVLQFLSIEDKQKMIDEMDLFNQQVRKPTLLPMPDIYCGQESLNQEVCIEYISEIWEFFEKNFETNVRIPIGLSNDKKMQFCVVNKDGIQGII